MYPSDSLSLDSGNTTLLCGCMPDSMFYPTTIPSVGIRFPGIADGTQPASRARDGNDVRPLRPIKCGDAFWIRLIVTLGITRQGRFGKNMEYS